MFTKVLVPLDSSDVSAGILPYVSYLAKGLDIPVVLASYLHPGTPASATIEAENWLGGYAHGMSEQSVRASAEVFTGTTPAEAILQLADQQRCDLIAMATHDRNLLGQAIRGSVTNEVVRNAQVPVLAISPEKDESGAPQWGGVSSILVPLDGSPFAEAALPYAEFLARKLALEVLLVRVVRETDLYPPFATAGMAADARTAEIQIEAERALEEEYSTYLKETAAQLAGKGLQARWELLRGPVTSSIASLAQEFPHNMIALTSHGRSGLTRWVMGSVAEDLIRGTGDPVLVIPSGLVEDEDKENDEI